MEIFELKWDGYRVLASKDQLLARNKKDATTWYLEITTALSKVRGSFVMDGEVCLLDERGLPDFESMRARTMRKTMAPVTYLAFDLLFLNERDLRTLPLIARKARLRKLIPIEHPRIRYVDYIQTEGEYVYRHAVASRLEGVIAKRAESPYVGGRSRDWLSSSPPAITTDGNNRCGN